MRSCCPPSLVFLSPSLFGSTLDDITLLEQSSAPGRILCSHGFSKLLDAYMNPPSKSGGTRIRLAPPEFAFAPGEPLELSSDTPLASGAEAEAEAGKGAGKETSWLISRPSMSAACSQALKTRRHESLAAADDSVMALFAADFEGDARAAVGDFGGLRNQFDVSTHGSSIQGGGAGGGSVVRVLNTFLRGRLTLSSPLDAPRLSPVFSLDTKVAPEPPMFSLDAKVAPAPTPAEIVPITEESDVDIV